jgi:hypothetical protein
MIVRLGNVLYWIGCAIAILILIVGAWRWYIELRFRSDQFIGLFIYVVPAVIAWVVGRACRYVFSGI